MASTHRKLTIINNSMSPYHYQKANYITIVSAYISTEIRTNEIQNNNLLYIYDHMIEYGENISYNVFIILFYISFLILS